MATREAIEIVSGADLRVAKSIDSLLDENGERKGSDEPKGRDNTCQENAKKQKNM